MNHRASIVAPLSWLLLGTCLGAARGDESAIRDWLARPILAVGQPQAEVEQYCDVRVPRMPPVASRDAWERYAAQIRAEMLDKVVYRGQAAAWRDAESRIVWLDTLDGGDGYRIRKLRYEAVPGLWIPAVLYEPTKLIARAAVALNVNGHDPNGKAADYKQIRSINQAKRGMLVLNPEWLGMGQLNGAGYLHTRMNQLDLCGTSGLAPFYLAMKRGLDVLLAHPNADPQRVAVSGLSGGGWQTIYISALDPRVTLSNPVAGYSSFVTRIHHHSDLGDSEQTPNDMATVADYAHLTALLAPRPALLTYNAKDQCCFASGHALQPLLDAAAPIYRLYGMDARLHSHVNHDPGTHNFERDNREAHYRLLVKEFFAGDTGVTATEIECQAEIKTSAQLAVELPEDNASFHSLAQELAATLPRDAQLPAAAQTAKQWQSERRELLSSILHRTDYEVVAEKVKAEERDGVMATWHRLRLSNVWTVPVVELARPNATDTVLLVADRGRESLAMTAHELVNAGRRVVVVDPFYIGESAIKSRPYLWALLVQTVGDRPAGLQASQLVAVARWQKAIRPNAPIELRADGERLSLAALCAAAVETAAVDTLRLSGSLATLKEVIHGNHGYDAKPELFCFGLLERFDVLQIAALVAPRPVHFTAPSAAHRAELQGLKGWYATLGTEFDPLP